MPDDVSQLYREAEEALVRTLAQEAANPSHSEAILRLAEALAWLRNPGQPH